MSTNKSNTKNIESTVEDIKFKASNSIEKNQKAIIAGVVILALLIGGYFGYKYLIKAPQEKEAEAAIYHAEKYFGLDSFQLALEGDGLNSGFLRVASEYSGTQIGNTANYYIALCYLYLGQPQDALKHFEKFNGKGTEFDQSKLGLMASAYYELGDSNKSLEYYQKAISHSNTVFSPQYLRAASILLFKNGQTEEAIKYEQRIKQEFTSSVEFRDADRYLAQYGYLN